MKLLLESWRMYLTERITDQVFSDTVDFLVDMYTDPKNFDWVSKEEEEEYEGPPWTAEDFEELMKDFGELGLKKIPQPGPDDPPPPPRTFEFYMVEPRQEELWDKFVEQVPQGPELLELNRDSFDHFMLLKIVYGIAYDVSVSKSSAGYFAGGEELVLNLKSSRFKISEKKYRNLTEDKIFKLIRSKATVVRMVIEHEFTHMLNYLRAGKAFARSKGIGRQHYKKSPEKQEAIKYVNSTEEIQARLIPIFKRVRDIVGMKQKDIQKSPENEVANLIKYETENFAGNQSISNIIKLLFKIYDLEHPVFLDHTSQSNKKRITKRFYEFAEELFKE